MNTFDKKSPTLLILAAGMGSRYGGLKQMDPMGPQGETVLDYSVYDAIRAGFTRVIFVIRQEFAESFSATVGARFSGKIQVDYAFQALDDLPTGFTPPASRTKPWGTSHAIRAARHLLDGPFAVINADDFYGQDSYRRAVSFLTNPSADDDIEHHAMVGYRLRNTLSDHGDVNRGICRCDENAHLLSVEEVVKIERESDGIVRGEFLDGERRPIADDSLVSMNFWAFPPSFLAHLEKHFTEFLEQHGHEEKSECYIPSVVDSLIHQGLADCQVLETSSSWFGVTYPQDKAHVVQNILALTQSGDYPSPLS
ncbi:MAG: nucleotidyltransferase [Verrucomicrobia bacterium]|jgi:NDP-sugar pyrophosphorylase family protein|nr:MAG: nucleotidyltransferase [Verrucomicrobiota bacterium]